MKKTFIKFFDKIILLLLGLSGILYSCAKYGMPMDEFELKGTITDSSKKPIKNIRIIREKEFYENREDTLYTNADGKYAIKLYEEHSIHSIQPIHLRVDDIDGEANGGDFYSTEIDVKFTNADLVKKGNNKRADKYIKILNIQLERKDEIYPKYGCPAAPFKP